MHITQKKKIAQNVKFIRVWACGCKSTCIHLMIHSYKLKSGQCYVDSLSLFCLNLVTCVHVLASMSLGLCSQGHKTHKHK